MKRMIVAMVILVLLTISSWPGAAAEDVSKPDTTTSTSDAGKKAKDHTPDPNADKVEAEYQARAKAESDGKDAGKRSAGYGTVVVSDTVDTVSTTGSILSSIRFSGPKSSTQTVALVVSPGRHDKDAAIGLQWISPYKWGVALWASGDLEGDDDIIDTELPHTDYHTETIKGSYAVEALYSVGSANSMLTGGLGVSITRTEHVAVSNVTGWKWEDGTERSPKIAAMIGWRARLGGRISFQYGYDTVQRDFFGLTVDL